MTVKVNDCLSPQGLVMVYWDAWYTIIEGILFGESESQLACIKIIDRT